MNASRRDAATAGQSSGTRPLLVRDLMTVGVPTCKPDSLVGDVARFLLEHDAEAMCVLDAEGQAIGVVGRAELVRVYGRDDVQALRAEDVMAEGIPELRAEMSLTVAAQIMQDKRTRIAYVMHNASGITYPAAYVSYGHILRHLAARDESELKGLNPAAARKSPVETFIARRDEARRKAEGL